MEEGSGNAVHDGDEQLLIGKYFDEGRVGIVREIDGAAIANGSDNLRSRGDRGEGREDLARMEIGRDRGWLERPSFGIVRILIIGRWTDYRTLAPCGCCQIVKSCQKLLAKSP